MLNSFVELNGKERAQALLEKGTFREIVGPLDQMVSPHLEPQGIVPQSDDGITLMLGKFKKHDLLIISMEGAFQGGGIGEVSGAKISAALEFALEENQNGKKVVPVMLFDTGGVRLQEANYGLLSISEIQNQVVALRNYVPVIGIVPGQVGAFGGMSIVAELFTTIIATNKARIGLNGPEVIEQEAGVMEFDASDKELIWNTIGAKQRLATRLVDEVVNDDVNEIIAALERAITAEKQTIRSQEVDFYLTLLKEMDHDKKWDPTSYNEYFQKVVAKKQALPETREGATPRVGRGAHWFTQLTGIVNPTSEVPTVLSADIEKNGQVCRYISIVPDTNNKFSRVRKGEVGLLEAWTVAQIVRDAVEQDDNNDVKRPIVAIIDVPSQAYGYKEELVCISLALASSVNAYATARQKGHPVIGLIVGNAISGAFLTHGLQSNRLIALDDDQINIQAMSKQSAARITKRTIAELEEATKKVPAMAYDVRSYKTLGALYQLVECINADKPSTEDVNHIELIIQEAITSTKGKLNDLSFRLQTKEALEGGRTATNQVRQLMKEQW